LRSSRPSEWGWQRSCNPQETSGSDLASGGDRGPCGPAQSAGIRRSEVLTQPSRSRSVGANPCLVPGIGPKRRENGARRAPFSTRQPSVSLALADLTRVPLDQVLDD
jgi:hypothetical protein